MAAECGGVWYYTTRPTRYYLNRNCYPNVHVINKCLYTMQYSFVGSNSMPVALCQYYYNQQSDIISQYAVYILDLALVQMCGYKCLC